jgi:hypothetical protein
MIYSKADEVMRLKVKISKPETVGPVTDGTLQVIPIVGGVLASRYIAGFFLQSLK